ncbi:dUTP diphosphatase [Robiginitalea sp. IMCC43444]|uniref:dUTP diphosphatase n=1 Tax=Robiginitalea sp. IMCC43444 TaxID=3459121 RepID=UPI004042EDF4
MKVKIVNKSGNVLPQYQTSGAAGMDLRAEIAEPITLSSLQRAVVKTGLFIELPAGYEAQIRPRSGFAAKQGVTVLNSPGTIDSDYRGEIGVILVNLSKDPVTISKGDRIAQMVIARHERAEWEEVSALTDSQRGSGGFGSTGKI